jgi:hypothetical protein
MRARRTLTFLALLTTAVLVGGAATAATRFDAVAKIHACTLKAKVIKLGPAVHCTKDQKRLTWNKRGPRGLTGAIGPIGPQGLQGPKGDTGATGPVPALSSVYKKESALGQGTNLGDGTFVMAEACDAGDILLSGGPANVSPDSVMVESFPSPGSTNSWSARIHPAAADNFSVVVLCLHH